MDTEMKLDARAIRYFETDLGAKIYQIPLNLFPMLYGYVYLVLVTDASQAYRILIDTGSGYGESNLQLEAGLRTIAEQTGEAVLLENLTHVLITHAHIDHFGGLSYVRPRTQALIGIHELDLRNVINYEQRVMMASQRLCVYLHEAGVAADEVGKLIGMYNLMKSVSHSVRVDFTYEALGMRLGPFEILHVPGHSAGHVVFRLHDVLFSGDHVLNDTSPHQSPERLTLSTGLDHYLRSLDALQEWAGPVKLTLGGHKGPIFDLNTRLDAIRKLHFERLSRVLELLEAPLTISDVSRVLFGDVHGYNVLLALEEAGAHVEYLYQRGKLEIVNSKEFDYCEKPGPIYYQRLNPVAMLDQRYAGSSL
jgi:glyoxylase-like metal-dependent hydrolase (beta-lactamase superfamily II)